VGPGDHEVRHAAGSGEDGVGAEIRVDLVDARPALTVRQRQPDRVRSRRDFHAEAARVVRFHLLAIDGDVDGRTPAASAEGEVVFGVEREGVANQHPAASAERQPVDVTILRQAWRRRERQLRRRHGLVADGKPADLERRRDVPLNERRRHGERFGEVIEALTRSIGRQQHVDVDIERQQIADGVGVLRAVQSVQRRCGECGVRVDRTVESRLELRREAIERCPLGATGAARRHHAGADLLGDLFPGLCISSDTGHVESVERQSRNLRALVVAADAVLRQERRFGRGTARSS
jgi:hypothetical protein